VRSAEAFFFFFKRSPIVFSSLVLALSWLGGLGGSGILLLGLVESGQSSTQQSLLDQVEVSLVSDLSVVCSVPSVLREVDGLCVLADGAAAGLGLADLEGIAGLLCLQGEGGGVDQTRVRLGDQAAQVSGLGGEDQSSVSPLHDEGRAVGSQEVVGEISGSHLDFFSGLRKISGERVCLQPPRSRDTFV